MKTAGPADSPQRTHEVAYLHLRQCVDAHIRSFRSPQLNLLTSLNQTAQQRLHKNVLRSHVQGALNDVGITLEAFINQSIQEFRDHHTSEL
jgi:hypothetical protein